MTAPESEGPRSWADLPVDMVDAVVQQLDLFSTTRLAVVCTSWAAAVAANAALPFGTPCLLITSEEEDEYGDRRDDYEEWTYQLMDLTRGIDDVSFPAFIWHVWYQWWVGGKDDWLAVVDEYGDARLLNPYTDIQIDLPRLTGVVKTGRAFERIVVCETSDESDAGYLVIGMVDKYHLAIARDGDESWTALRNPHEDGRPLVSYWDAVVHKGKVCAVDRYGDVYTWDIQGGACPDPEELGPHDRRGLKIVPESWKLAESADGRRLLLVVTYGKIVKCPVRCYLEFAAQGMRVYERDVDAADAAGWSPVTSLGDQSLFLGANYPFFARVAVNQEGHGVQPNCVCLARGEIFGIDDYDVEVFDLGAEKYNQYKLFWSGSREGSYYQVPIWFRPRLEAGLR